MGKNAHRTISEKRYNSPFFFSVKSGMGPVYQPYLLRNVRRGQREGEEPRVPLPYQEPPLRVKPPPCGRENLRGRSSLTYDRSEARAGGSAGSVEMGTVF